MLKKLVVGVLGALFTCLFPSRTSYEPLSFSLVARFKDSFDEICLLFFKLNSLAQSFIPISYSFIFIKMIFPLQFLLLRTRLYYVVSSTDKIHLFSIPSFYNFLNASFFFSALGQYLISFFLILRK